MCHNADAAQSRRGQKQLQRKLNGLPIPGLRVNESSRKTALMDADLGDHTRWTLIFWLATSCPNIPPLPPDPRNAQGQYLELHLGFMGWYSTSPSLGDS